MTIITQFATPLVHPVNITTNSTLPASHAVTAVPLAVTQVVTCKCTQLSLDSLLTMLLILATRAVLHSTTTHSDINVSTVLQGVPLASGILTVPTLTMLPSLRLCLDMLLIPTLTPAL